MSFSSDQDYLVDQSKQGETILLRVSKRLCAAQTKFQQVQLIETEAYGRALVLDGSIQAAAADEFIYHESLVHPAMLASAKPARVAVLGGGEGATLREVLRHQTVRQATMIDIDQEVVAFCRQYLPTFHQGAFDDPRTTLLYQDARAWISAQAEGSLDVVIVDITEPLEDGPARLLFTKEFYQLVHRALAENGVIEIQAGPADPVQHSLFARLVKTIESVFGWVQPMVTYIPSYADQWGFILAGRGQAAIPPAAEIKARLAQQVDGQLRHYDAEAQAHIRNLPLYLRQSLNEQFEPFMDQDPPLLAPGIR